MAARALNDLLLALFDRTRSSDGSSRLQAWTLPSTSCP